MFASVVVLSVIFPVFAASEPVVLAPVEEEEEYNVHTRIKFYADQYKVSAYELTETIRCETAGTFDPNIQSQWRYNYSDPKRGIVIGTQERSYGLGMYHLPDHPDMTEAMAKDPEYALNRMAREFSEGKKSKWYCWQKLFR